MVKEEERIDAENSENDEETITTGVHYVIQLK